MPRISETEVMQNRTTSNFGNTIPAKYLRPLLKPEQKLKRTPIAVVSAQDIQRINRRIEIVIQQNEADRNVGLELAASRVVN